MQTAWSNVQFMAEDVARERTPVDGMSAEREVDPQLETRLAEAERDTEDLQKELAKLDAEWSKRLETMPAGEAGAAEHPTAVANVISLANRIRDLKKGMGPST